VLERLVEIDASKAGRVVGNVVALANFEFPIGKLGAILAEDGDRTVDEDGLHKSRRGIRELGRSDEGFSNTGATSSHKRSRHASAAHIAPFGVPADAVALVDVHHGPRPSGKDRGARGNYVRLDSWLGSSWTATASRCHSLRVVGDVVTVNGFVRKNYHVPFLVVPVPPSWADSVRVLNVDAKAFRGAHGDAVLG